MNRNRLIRAAATVAVAVATTTLAVTSASSASPASSTPTITLTVTANQPVIVGGSQTSGAVKIVTTVRGEPMAWATLIRLNPGVTPAEFFRFAHRSIDAIGPYGSIVLDAAATAGTSSVRTVLQPGTYVADDLYGSANPSHEFTVNRSPSPAAQPTSGATITTTDLAIQAPASLHDGELVRIQNDGYLAHTVNWARTSSLATAKRAEELLLAGELTQAKKYATAAGALAGVLTTRGSQQLTITQKPGAYIIYSTWTLQDGRADYQLGMVRTIGITK